MERMEGGYVVCFPLNVLMVHSPKPTLVANDNNQTVGSFLGNNKPITRTNKCEPMLGRLKSSIGQRNGEVNSSASEQPLRPS
jgi:hypothetical protein